ncbi:hypothetical protein L218DRAFT_716534 [Marasmius fiardii PR-910]|nr:hypothetical protein L218DRAFT_716534 [Marasmius fiardii PR-910]
MSSPRSVMIDMHCSMSQQLHTTDSAFDSPDMSIADFTRKSAVGRVRSAMESLKVEEDGVYELVDMVERQLKAESLEGISLAMGDLCPFNILVYPWIERVAVID